MTLIDIFNTIQPPKESDAFHFSAAPITKHSTHRIAKDKASNPVLLLSTSSKEKSSIAANIKLQNVSVLVDINCKISQGTGINEKQFTAICFTGKEDTLKQYFLKLCSTIVNNLKNNPSAEEVRKEINQFIELLKLITEPQKKTVQGLWAELFLISSSRDPETLMKYWHSIAEEKFDFTSGEERIEIKSYSNSQRIHSFSIEQLYPPIDTSAIIVSVCVKQVNIGKSIELLICEIIERLSGNVELIEKLHFQVASTLGKTIQESIKVQFDSETARDSIRFYHIDDIPKIQIQTIPASVTNVHFSSDLTNVPNVMFHNMERLGELFNAVE